MNELGASPQIAIALAIVSAVIGGVIMMLREMRKPVPKSADSVSRKDIEGIRHLIESAFPGPGDRMSISSADDTRKVCAQHASQENKIETLIGDVAEARFDIAIVRKDVTGLKAGQERILDYITNGKEPRR